MKQSSFSSGKKMQHGYTHGIAFYSNSTIKWKINKLQKNCFLNRAVFKKILLKWFIFTIKLNILYNNFFNKDLNKVYSSHFLKGFKRIPDCTCYSGKIY